MVSPSKTKHSRVAANQQQKTATASKVRLVKGPTPLVHHRFYLDIQKHQLANKIEYTIKELGGHIEFFLSKDITHFITDKDPSHYQRVGGPDPDGGPSNSYNPGTPGTPLTPKTPLSNRHHQHLQQQYVNEASPSSSSCGLYGAAAASHSSLHPLGSVGASGATGGSESRSVKPAAPRSRADAMLQRVRQQQQQQQQQSPSTTGYGLLAGRTSRPCSPASPAPAPSPTPAATTAIRLDRNSQSPAQLAKSWGKPIWSTEYAIKFLSKVIGSVKQEQGQGQGQPHQLQPQLGKGGQKGDSGSKTTPQHLRGDYIKIESHQRHHYRPAFALFKAWPSLNFATKSNHSPFDSARGPAGGGGGRSVAQQPNPAPEERPSVKTTATATTNQTNVTNTTATAKQEPQQQCGYCEICRIEYDVLANHLNADEHRAFVRNDGNFEALDQLIADGGVGLGAFLKKEEELTEPEDVPASESVNCETKKDTVKGAEEECEEEEEVVKAKKRKVEEEEEEERLIQETIGKIVRAEEEALEVRKPPLKTYARKSKEKLTNPEPDAPQSKSPAKRTYAGRKAAAAAARVAAASTPKPSPSPEEPTEPEAPAPPVPEPIQQESEAEAVSHEQMFGRRSAIHHHPHNTLNHHNHQKAKAARQQAAAAAAEAEAAAAAVLDQEDGMKLQRHAAGAAAAMGMKQSQCVKSSSTAAELMECDGLDPKNTKRISLGLRQNPKRANLNEDFTSLLDETLEPIRKPRIRRESVRRVNYSEPREDEIASQEELIESILLESTAQEAAAAAAVEESCRGKKKGGSPKRGSSDVKIRGIRWRAPSPQSRPPVKSPLLYKVIEDPKPKSKKINSTSPSKEVVTAGSPTKATKNGLIVKIRRVRQSELSLLNDEAENFMFPKKDDSSDEDTDEDRQTSSETGLGDYSQEVPSSDYDHHHNSSKRKSAGTPLPSMVVPVKKRPAGKPTPTDSPSKRPAKESTPDADTPRGRRVGNRGVAALLHDNAEYYKFPDPGSRLRFPEAPIQPDPEAAPAIVDVDEAATLMTPPPPPPPKRRGRKPASATIVAAATATSSAAELKQQQDLLLAARTSPEQLTSCGKAIISYCNSKHQQQGKEDGMGAMFKWSTFVRNCAQIEPYRFAFERVPSLEPWYETFQRQDEASEKMYEYFGNTAYRKLPYEMGGLPPLRQNCCILNYRMKSKTPESTVPSSSASSTCDGATTATGKDPAAKPNSSSTEAIALPLKKRKLLVDSDRPRKSPREHASTLAILSLLQQQTQHNRRRTLSGGSSSGTSVPLVTTANLPPPSPVAGYSPKKEAIKQQQQQQQEADSALGDEIRSSCGSDPVTEKDEPIISAPSGSGAKKIKFDPPIMPEMSSFVNYKVMCQQLEDFLDSSEVEDLDLPTSSTSSSVSAIAPSSTSPLKQNLARIVQACDKEPPLSLKLVSRHESIVRKIVQYDRRPRPLSAISIKSFDGGGGGGSSGTASIGTATGTTLGIFKKRINRTGWPNVKKRIVTRKAQQQAQQQQQQKGGNKRDSGESVKKEEPEDDPSRKSLTEESQVSSVVTAGTTTTTTAGGEEEEEAVKQEVSVVEDVEEEEGEDEEEDEDDDEDEFEDTMTMLDPEEVPPVAVSAKAVTNGETAKDERLLTDDETDEGGKEVEEEREEQTKEEMEESRTTPEPTKTEEILIPSRSCPRSSSLPSSKYVTKTTTTMTRIDYNVPPFSNADTKPGAITDMATSAAAAAEECDSISSRSIFVSDDCDTTSSTLINMCPEADPLALPCTPPVDAVPSGDDAGSTRSTTPVVVRGRPSSVKQIGSVGRRKAGGGLQPVVCLQKINCGTATTTTTTTATATLVASSMRTRSSSRTPIKKTYKRSVFTSALVNSSGKPLKKKRKRKKLSLLNGTASPSPTVGTTSPSCSEDQNSSSLDCDEDDSGTRTDGTDSPSVTPVATAQRGRPKNRAPTPSPVKFSPRKLRKPRGRWYRER